MYRIHCIPCSEMYTGLTFLHVCPPFRRLPSSPPLSRHLSAGSLAARNVNHARSQVAASAALTKRSAKAKRGTPRVKPSTSSTSSTSSSKGLKKAKVANPYAKGSTFLSTKAALAAAQIRCNKNSGGDAKCGTLTTPPDNASGLCYQARCTFRELISNS